MDDSTTAGSGRPRVLFLCTGNSCRSQMAEGLLRAKAGGRVEALSAGTKPHGLNPLAVRAMSELNIDISRNTSKSVADLAGTPIDLAVTVCDSARESCPMFPGAKKTIHHSFDDPPALAKTARSEEEAMPHYRRVRDEISQYIDALLAQGAF